MQRSSALMILCVLCCGRVANLYGWTQIGDIVTNVIAGDRVDFELSSGAAARVQVLDPGLVRVRVNPAGTLSNRGSPAIAPKGLLPPNSGIFDADGAVWLVTSRMRVSVRKSPFQVVAWHEDGTLMFADTADAVSWDADNGGIVASKICPPDEHFFGLGMSGGPIDRRGRSLVMRNTDNSAYAEFTDPLYQSYPFYYSLRGGKAYGIFLDNPAFPFFDMNSGNQGRVLFGAQSGELDYYILAGPDPFQVANTYARLTGFNPLPPKWSLGYQHSRYGWQSAQEMLDIASRLRSLNFPCDALWFDIDYMDERHHFTWDPAGFPDPADLHDDLEALGFKRVYISEPCLLQTDPLWSYMRASGHFLRDAAGQTLIDSIWFGDVSFIDFTKSATRSWYKQQLKTFLSMGISGLWLDLNEPANNFMPDAIYDFDGEGRSDLESRNLYALLEAGLAYDAQLEVRPNVRPWNFSRSGYSGIQRYAHTWSGDAPSTFESLRVAVQMSISMGLSGQNQFGHDTGGFLGSPSGELFSRWLEFSCFTPLFRNHSVNTANPREPWSFGEPYTSLIRDIIRERYQWLPYIYTLFEEASRTGRPVLAPTFFYAPGDPSTCEQDAEYCFGPNLLVAPVFEAGATSRTLYLPAGSDWIDFRTEQRYSGGQRITVPAIPPHIPLFVRAGAILVRGAAMSYVGAPADPTLTADIFPSGDSSFTLYEDDGSSFDFQSGILLRTELRSSWDQNGGKISVLRVEGDLEPPARSWSVSVHEVSIPPQRVELNGSPLLEVASQTALNASASGWFYDARRAILTMRFPDGTNSMTVTVAASLYLTTQPARQTIAACSSATFTVEAGGSTPLSFQWLFNGTNVLAGQTGASLALTNVQPPDAGNYSVLVTNSFGAVTSRVATLTVIVGGVGLLLNQQREASVTFTAMPEVGYSIQYCSDLTALPWLNFTNVSPRPSTNLIQRSDPSPALFRQRFYRIVTPIQTN